LEEHFDLRSLGYEQNACQASMRALSGLLLTGCLRFGAVERGIWWERTNSACRLCGANQHRDDEGKKIAAQPCGLDGIERIGQIK
jgi:hypothetical protein